MSSLRNLALNRGIFNTVRAKYNTSKTRVCSRHQGLDSTGPTADSTPAIADSTSELRDWIQEISDRRGFSINLLTQLCGGPASGKPIELWPPSQLNSPEQCRACWGADPFARIAIARPPLRAIRFLNGDGSIFQVAFEAQTQSGQWLAINSWYEQASQEFGDRLWLGWVKSSQRSHLGKYLSPVGEGEYRPVWTPNLTGAIANPIDWATVGANKKTTKWVLEGPWKAVAALLLGVVPVCLAGVDAGVVGQTHQDRGQLRPEIAALLATGKIAIAFDQDSKPATVKRVSEAIDRLTKAIGKLKPVSPQAKGDRARRVIEGLVWPAEIEGRSTKGIDDLLQVVGIDGVGQQAKIVPIARLIARGRAIGLTRQPNLEIELNGTESLAIHAQQIWEAVKAQGYSRIALSAPTGAGKTELVKAILKSFDWPLVYLSPRITLNNSEAPEFEATPRAELDGFTYLCESTGKYITQKVPPRNGRITMCLEGFESISLSSFFPKDTVLFGDEFDQMIDQLMDGATLKGKQRAAYDWLSSAVKIASTTIVASAGLRDQHINWLEETTGDQVFLIKVKRTGDSTFYNAEIDQSKDYSGVIERITQAIQSGDRVLLPCDSRTKLEAIKAYFDSEFVDDQGNPKYRFEIATRETGSNPEIKAASQEKGDYFYREIQAGRPIHIFGYTTHLGTGWSLKNPCGATLFGLVAGINTGTISPESFRQMVNRYRSNCPRVIWAKKKSAKRGRLSKLTTTKGVVADIIESRDRAAKATKSPQEYQALKDSGLLDPKRPSLYLKTWSEALANDNGSRAVHRESLAAKLAMEGRAINWVALDTDPGIVDAIQDRRIELDKQRAIALYKAPKLTLKEFLDLERKETKTNDDYLAIERFKLEDFYCLDLGLWEQEQAVEFILRDRCGSRRPALRQLSRVIGKYAAMHQQRDIASISRAINTSTLWEVKHDSAVSNLFAALRFSEILELETYDSKTPLIREIYENARNNPAILKGVRRWLDSEGKILNTSSPIAFVNAILRGVDIEVCQDKESKVWEIDRAYLAESTAILDRQFDRWAKQNQATQDQPTAEPQPEPTPEPIAQPQPTVITETKPAPAPIEFWTVAAGKHQGDRVRLVGPAKGDRQIVRPVGRFDSYTVGVSDLKPWQATQDQPEPQPQPIAQPSPEPPPMPSLAGDSPLDRANYLWDLWEQGAVAQAAKTIRGWFREIDTQTEPLGLSRLKTAVCAALPGLEAFWNYALLNA